MDYKPIVKIGFDSTVGNNRDKNQRKYENMGHMEKYNPCYFLIKLVLNYILTLGFFIKAIYQFNYFTILVFLNECLSGLKFN